ncbi:MAG: aldo/keto reductase [Bacteroidaceae bacterium]|nr:aldo/keto reductase [Bacteroidaceae bacterium]
MLTLSNGNVIPQLGVGTWTLRDNIATENVSAALKAGFRLIDTAQMYQNEAEVGRGLALSGMPRSDYMVTTKVSNDMMRAGQDAVYASVAESLDKLGCGYLDFLLVHWPVKDRIKDTWQVMEEYVMNGKVRNIGVCNFNPHHIEDLMVYARIKPVINQIELHPLHSQENNVSFDKSLGIQVQSWGPFGHGLSDIPSIPEIRAIAAQYDRTPSQIILRWILQRGLACIPRAKVNHFKENLHVTDFVLSPEHMLQISALNQDRRSSEDDNPEDFAW